MSKKLLRPDDLLTVLRRRFANQHQFWLAGAQDEEGWPKSFPLGVPSQDQVASDLDAIRTWVSAWKNWQGAGTVHWETRKWSLVGTQDLPVRLTFDSPADLSAAVGQGTRWGRAVARYGELGARWPQLAARGELARQFNALADYPDADFARLIALLAWLETHPASGLYLRQIPVESMDTKWVEQRKPVILALARSLLPTVDEAVGFETVLGLKRAPLRIRLRVLCPVLRQAFGGLGDIEAPLAQVVQLPLRPDRVIIVENMQTGLALPDLPGTVAFMGLGHGVGVLEQLPWLQGAAAVYWGDLDTHGFAILDRARRALPGLESVLMDEAALLGHRSLWVDEPSPYCGPKLTALTPAEFAVFEGLRDNLWGSNVRLEQERLSWPEALSALMAMVGH